MMRLSLASFLAAGMFAFGAPALSMAAPQVPADGLDFAGSKKTVKFNHSTHAKEACETCHHKVDGKENFQKCATAGCHDDLTGKQPPKSLFAVVHSKKELAHQTCMTCHVKVAGDDAAKKKELTGCKGSKCHPA